MPDGATSLQSPPTVGRYSTFGQTKKPFIAFAIATGGPSVNDYISRIEWLENLMGIPFHQFADLAVATSAGGLISLAATMPHIKTGKIAPASELKRHFAEATPILMKPSLSSCMREWRLMSSQKSRSFFQDAWGNQTLSCARTNVGVYTASGQGKKTKTHLLRSYNAFKPDVRSFRSTPAYQAAAATMAIPFAFRPERIGKYDMYDAAGHKALPYRKTVTQAMKLAQPGQPIVVIAMTPGDNGGPVSWYTRNVFKHPPRPQIVKEIAKVSREFPEIKHIVIDPYTPDLMQTALPSLLDVSEKAIAIYHEHGILAMEQHRDRLAALKAQRGLSCAYV